MGSCRTAGNLLETRQYARPSCPASNSSHPVMSASRWALVAGIASLLLGSHYSGYIQIFSGYTGSSLVDAESESNSERWACRPFLPNVHAQLPPSSSHPAIHAAIGNVDDFFTRRFAEGDIDSLSVAIVTSGGTLYERNFGVMRGNETTTSLPTHSHSMYRLASVSKLFTALEGLILEEKGIISWYVMTYCAPPLHAYVLWRLPGTIVLGNTSTTSSIGWMAWIPAYHLPHLRTLL